MKEAKNELDLGLIDQSDYDALLSQAKDKKTK